MNAKVDGLASYPAAVRGLVDFLTDHEVGMIQLPCPETEILGVQRWGHVKDQLSHPFFSDCYARLLIPFVRQAAMYREQGYNLLGIVGVDGSPSCGVKKTCRSGQWGGDFLDSKETWKKVENLKWVKEPGIFMETFQKMLAEKELSLQFYGLDEAEAKASLPGLIDELSRVLDA
nr:CD3072 family TudS-related putative desulfidase [Desulfospira joergensenii]